MTSNDRATILGQTVDLLDIDELTQAVVDLVATGRRHAVANHNLHSLYLVESVAAMRRFYERASLTHLDGMGLVAIGQILGQPVHRRHRVTYIDWLPRLLQQANLRRWRVFFLGSTSDTVQRGIDLLATRFPHAHLAGHHGFLDSPITSQSALEAVRNFGPDLLFVGMGMPLQEQWISQNWDCLPNAVILNSGACLEYVTGRQRTPPRWLGGIGLEWAFRLATNPRRLASRYLVEPWGIGFRMIRHLGNTLR